MQPVSGDWYVKLFGIILLCDTVTFVIVCRFEIWTWGKITGNGNAKEVSLKRICIEKIGSSW